MLGSGTTAGSYEFFDSAGAVYQATIAAPGLITPSTTQQDFSDANTVYNSFSVAGDADMTASNIRKEIDIFGVTGTLVETPDDCAANGDIGCVTTASFKAADLTNLTASNIKRGVSIAGTTGDFPSSQSPLPRYSDDGATSSETGSDQTDLTLFASQLTTDGSFEFWDSSGRRYTGSGDSDIVSSNVKKGVAFENLSITGTMQMRAPTGLAASYNNTTNEMSLSWDDMGASSYLLIVREGAKVSFVPSDGTSYTAGAQGSDTIIYVGSSTSYTHTGLTDNNTYYYALYSVDSNDYYSAVTTLTKKAFSCAGIAGGDWVEVPGDPDYGTSDFCVMKYEAKNDGLDTPTSTASGAPWVSISQTTSITECQSLGSGYDLISNDQWMSLASNIAAQATNWSGASVGSGNLNRGHSDDDPPNACDGTQEYVDTDCSNSGGESSFTEKRTHSLSNGAEIWDLSGNVWDWTSYVIADNTDKPTPQLAQWQEYTTPIVGSSSMPLTQLRPTNDLKAFWDDSWNAAQSIGQYLAGSSGSGGALPRGASWLNGSDAGVFAAGLNSSPSDAYSNLGFRCVRAFP